MSFSMSSNNFFNKTFFYNCTVFKHELLKSHAIKPVIQNVRSFKEYGKWQFQFWPDQYSANNPQSYCIRLISVNPKNLGIFYAKISIFISDGHDHWISICKNVYQRITKIIPAFGIINLNKSFLQDYPETLKWEKILFEIQCCFTVCKENLINEQNWITLKLLQRYKVEEAANIFVNISDKTKELCYVDVDSVIICQRKWFMFWKPKKISIPVHKKKLIEHSSIFTDMLSQSNAILIPPKFSVSTTEKIVLFCYQGYLKRYEKCVIKFAIKYQMKKLLSKADKKMTLKDDKLLGKNDSKILSKNSNQKCSTKNSGIKITLKNMLINCFFFVKNMF